MWPDRDDTLFRIAVSSSLRVVIVAGVVACRQQQPAPPAPLEPNPEISARLEKEKASTAFFNAARAMTPQQITELEAALQKDPEDVDARNRLRIFYRFSDATASDRNRAFSEKLKSVPREKQAEVVAALPDPERIAVLPQRADMEYMNAEYYEYTKRDPAAAKAAWEQTRKYAEDMLTLADNLPNDPHRATAIFSGHVTMAALALHDNDMAAALKHMDEAGKAPASEGLRYGFNALWQRLATGMLKRGAREAVAQFLDRYAQLTETGREQLTKSAAAIRAGRMPDFYQYQVTPR